MSNPMRVPADHHPIPGSRMSADQFSRLIGTHLDVVWRLATYLSRSPAQAEELVERCARLAFARRATLVSTAGVKPWFLGLLVEIWQQSAPRNLRLVDDPSPAAGDAYELIMSAGNRENPAEALLERCAPEDICRALCRLPAEDRVVTALSLADDLTYREIGLILALSPDTVRTRLHRGRAVLKMELVERLSGATEQ